MRLVYKIMLSFTVPLVITLSLWGWLSYKTMTRKIHADTDLILKEYAEDIIMRKLSGREMPARFNGAYNTYYIREVTAEYAAENPVAVFDEAEAYLRSQEEFASSRVRSQVFMDNEGRYFEIIVSMPTFEQDLLVEHVLWWTMILFAVLLIALLVIGALVLSRNLRPFYRLLRWMEEYEPGENKSHVPSDTDILEFRKLASVVQTAVDRFEHQYEERKLFVGNVSHELQTPLAVCSNRLEILLERPDLNEAIAEELVRLHRSLQHLIRLNRTLLLLTRIENDQFPDLAEVDLGTLIEGLLEENDELWSYKNISSSFEKTGDFKVVMNEQMASVLVGNLVKNAYVHSSNGSMVEVVLDEDGFSISNPGDMPLDGTKIFRRFYQPLGRKEGSTGLGLSLAYSVCARNGMTISYSFMGSRHVFRVNLKK